MFTKHILRRIFCIALLLASCQFPEAGAAGVQAGTIKIGLIVPLSGQMPTFGVSATEGAALAVREWNAKGGVLGLPVELITADGQCEANAAVKAAEQLIDQEGVRYLVGEICSTASIPVSEIAAKKGVVQISPTATNPAVTLDTAGQVKSTVFRAAFTDRYQGALMARFAARRGYRTAFILYNPEDAYGRGLAEAFEKAFLEAGGKIVGKATYRSGKERFYKLLRQVNQSEAQVLYLPDYYNVANLIGAQARERRLNVVLMGGDGWDSDDLGLQAMEGGFYPSHYDLGDTRPIAQAWLKTYSAAYLDPDGRPKAPDALAALSYDATNLLIAAIQQAGVDDPQLVAAALAGLHWEGVTGTIRFDAQHNPIKNAAIMGIMDGKKVFVESIPPP